MLPSAMMPTTAWRTRTCSSRQLGRRHPLMCCGRSPNGPAAESSAEKEGFLNQRWRMGCGERDWGYREELPSGHVFCSRLWVAVSHLLGDFGMCVLSCVAEVELRLPPAAVTAPLKSWCHGDALWWWCNMFSINWMCQKGCCRLRSGLTSFLPFF